MSQPVTRRTVLTGAAVGAGALAAGPLLPKTARATTPGQADLARQSIKHVVFLMMENRSFDHLYGSLSGVRGFDDRSVGAAVFAQYDPTTAATRLPYRISEANMPPGDIDLSHNWLPQHASLNGGKNDSWVVAHTAADGAAKAPVTMAYLTRPDVPFHYAMADAFTICDNYFCSVLGPTYPNRLMYQMGSLDPDGTGGGPLVTADDAVFTNNATLGVFSYRTYPELLTEAGVTWKAYTEPASNHLLNMFPTFTQYNAPGGDPVNVANGTAGASTGAFLADLNAGTLPQVSWIFPFPHTTEHPEQGPVNAGPQFYEPIINAFITSESWADTALFITWDENDGFFDHVPPPQAPPGTPLEYLTAPPFGTTAVSDPSFGLTGPVGLGFRVPNLVVSQWSTGGRVNSEVFDHTSCLKLVETLFGVPLKGQGLVSDWRHDLVGDLTSCFDFSRPTPTVTPATVSALAEAFRASQELFVTHSSGDETPPAVQTMPTQETMPVRERVGPEPAFTSDEPAVLPEFGHAGLAVAGAAVLSAIALNRIRTGGVSDSTMAGRHLTASADPAP